jgi:hypothetical protein
VRNDKPLFYRQLPQTEEDWARLRSFLGDVKGFVPPAHLGVAAIADTFDGEIAAALVLQMVPYLGPFKVGEGWAGRVDHARLRAVIDQTFKGDKQNALIVRGYVAMTDDEGIATIAERAGMRRLDCITLVRTLDEQRPIPTL